MILQSTRVPVLLNRYEKEGSAGRSCGSRQDPESPAAIALLHGLSR